jgi:hypothetical protein
VDSRILCAHGAPSQAQKRSESERRRYRYPEWGTRFEKWRWWAPYGMWTCADGRRVLFNRDYVPIYERRPGKLGRIADHDEYVPWVRQEWFYDGGNSPVNWFSVPLSAWKPVVRRINSLLVDWALPTLRPRPPKRSSSPRTRRLWEEREFARQHPLPQLWALAPAYHMREIEKRKVSPLKPWAIINKHKIEPGKLRNYIFRGEPKWPYRSDVHYWIARSLLERRVPPSEAYILLKLTEWNKHKYENEYRWEEMTWRVIEKAWSKPFVPWREQLKRGETRGPR